ncbi:tetratricopeptide repeat protein [Nitrospirillum viridazoti]|uniref:Sulfotransferase n=1 Tax=Nitrospirillum viridazoti CBAmc TaxID=1441467 RepID=A0A248JN44_9PROT|nr:tetratricopeptide repeat protein [Nitrospirillum amazonense]ASG19890.1 sulfotransferase [Nitrospirillum amazonense CBAmc]TWB36438.1 tetratricopeptide (TPR) repeat protein [Nitrospirillum amazonense]
MGRRAFKITATAHAPAGPNQADYNQVVARFHAGDLAGVESACRHVLAQNPRQPAFLHVLGLVAQARGQSAIAAELIGEAVALRPDDSAMHGNLGIALAKLGRLDAAEGAYRRAIALRPDNADAHSNLGNVLRHHGRWDEAEAEYRQALSLRPTFAEAHSNLGNALRQREDLDGAEAAYRQALALRPAYPEGHYNLGNVLLERGRTEEAIACYRAALAFNPRLVEAHNNLGSALKALADMDGAIACYQAALAIDPRYAEARYNLGLAWLGLGDYPRGWAAYEWRWASPDFRPHRRPFAQKTWRGEDMAGGTLLLHAEQGYGDTLQFCRYIPLVAARCRRVVVEVPPPLLRLLRTSPALVAVGDVRFIARGMPLPDFDLHCPLMSLPLALDTRLETAPAATPYLTAAVAAPIAARDRPCVGIAWSGNPTYKVDRRRSLTRAQVESLVAACPEVEFHSLQKDPDAAGGLPDGVVDRMGDVADFADTAALVQAMDLVISVDTSVVHLAGALGRPVWLLNRFDSDWRWLRDRDDSPWYPTLRQFRQEMPGDWYGVLARVAASLDKWNPRA